MDNYKKENPANSDLVVSSEHRAQYTAIRVRSTEATAGHLLKPCKTLR